MQTVVTRPLSVSMLALPLVTHTPEQSMQMSAGVDLRYRPRHPPLRQVTATLTCSGDKTQYCGAGNRLSVVVNNNAPVFGAPLQMLDWWAYACMSDSTSSRTLPHMVSLSNYGGASNVTFENGLRACAAQGYIWCGFEYGQEVYGIADQGEPQPQHFAHSGDR